MFKGFKYCLMKSHWSSHFQISDGCRTLFCPRWSSKLLWLDCQKSRLHKSPTAFLFIIWVGHFKKCHSRWSFCTTFVYHMPGPCARKRLHAATRDLQLALKMWFTAYGPGTGARVSVRDFGSFVSVQQQWHVGQVMLVLGEDIPCVEGRERCTAGLLIFLQGNSDVSATVW